MSVKTLLCFSGQGSQFPGMGHSLYRAHGGYRAWVRRLCDAVDTRLLSYFEEPAAPSGQRWDELAETHPLLFIVQAAYGLAWRECGRPVDAVMGFSLGELVAGAVAGMLEPEMAAILAAEQARHVLDQTAPAVMVALVGDPPGSWASKAPVVIGGPGRTMWVFPDEEWPECQAALKASRIPHQVLAVRRGFHSPLLLPARDGLLALAGRVPHFPGDLPVYSATLGRALLEGDGAAHWVEVLEDPIDMPRSVPSIDQDGPWLYLDAGPSGAVAQMVKALLPVDSKSVTRITQSPFGKHPTDLDPGMA